MKKLLLVALSVCLLVAFALPALASADLTISTPQDLADFAASVNAGNDFSGKKVVLAANIDLSGIADWTPIGMGDHYFKGEFDGQGHTISNLTQTSGTRMGLFGLVGNAYLHDFTLKNVSFTANGNSTRIGAVVGNLQHWNVVKDITVDGVTLQVTGNDGLIGAAFGYVWKSQVSNVNTKNVKITVSGDSNCIAAHTAYGRAHIWDLNVAGNNAHWLDGTEQSSGMVVQNLFANCSVSGAQITVSSGSGNEIGGFFGSDTYNYHSNYFYHDTVTGLRIDCTGAANSIAGGFIAFNKGAQAAAQKSAHTPKKALKAALPAARSRAAPAYSAVSSASAMAVPTATAAQPQASTFLPARKAARWAALQAHPITTLTTFIPLMTAWPPAPFPARRLAVLSAASVLAAMVLPST